MVSGMEAWKQSRQKGPVERAEGKGETAGRRNGIFRRRSRQWAKGKRAEEGTAGWQNGILQSLQKGSMVMAKGKATAEGIMAGGKGLSRWKGRERDGGGTEGKREVSGRAIGMGMGREDMIGKARDATAEGHGKRRPVTAAGREHFILEERFPSALGGDLL